MIPQWLAEKQIPTHLKDEITKKKTSSHDFTAALNHCKKLDKKTIRDFKEIPMELNVSIHHCSLEGIILLGTSENVPGFYSSPRAFIMRAPV
jgi:hypothetical protein